MLFFHILAILLIAPQPYGAHDCDMTAPHGRLFNRGASILSALVFVALLAGVATTVQYFSPYSNPRSQTAAPGGIGSDAVAAQQATANAELANKCAVAIAAAKTAATKKTASKPTGKTEDDCVGAVKDTSERAGYRCVGKSAKVNVINEGNITVESQPNPNLPPGKCVTLACTPPGYRLFDGDGSIATGGLSPNMRCLTTTLSGVNKASVLQSMSVANSNGTLFSVSKAGGFITNADSSSLKSLGQVLGGEYANGNSIPLDSNGTPRLSAYDQIAKYAAESPDQDALDSSKKVTESAVILNPDLADKSALTPGPKVEDIQKCLKDASLPGCINRNSLNGTTKRADPSSTFSDPNAGKNQTGGSNPMSALSSMLQGLMKALGAPQPPAAPAQACATDPNAYAQQQQQYQQQLQQYNYQLQQQQYQQQLGQLYAQQYGGIAPPSQPPPTQPTPCTPSTGSQCKTQPQQPPSSACSAGAWRATYSGACITGWQCISTEGPKAELVCEPKVADVGSTLAITYGCSSGVASSSSFAVTTQPGGSATTTVKAPPQGTNTATYTLACTDQGRTTGAQCSIQVARANIILVANPKTVPAGGTSLLSWLTTGMESCIISSPDQPDFTERNSSNTSVVGAATTSAIATSAQFLLHCETVSGAVKDATTTIQVQ